MGNVTVCNALRLNCVCLWRTSEQGDRRIVKIAHREKSADQRLKDQAKQPFFTVERLIRAGVVSYVCIRPAEAKTSCTLI